MQFGIFTVGDVTTDPTAARTPSEHERIKAMIAVALKAEEVGLDVFATGEHHNPPFVPSSPTTMLGHIAARTEKLILSTATTLITTNDPVKIAEDFAMLQHLADGRVDLMPGRGNTGPSTPGSGRTSGRALRSPGTTTRCCTGCGARTWSTGTEGSAPRCSPSPRPRARWTAYRPSSGTAPSAPGDRRPGVLATATASSTATSSGRPSTRGGWFSCTGGGTPTTVTAAPKRPSSVSAVRPSCGGTRRTPYESSAPTSTTRRSTGTAPPVFTASYSGLFKSFFDLIDPDALAGKPVLIAATGGTARHPLVLEHALRPLFSHLRAAVVPTAVYAASEDWGSGGDAYTEGLPARVRRAGSELAVLMAARPSAAVPEDDVTALELQLSDLCFD